MKRLLNSNLAVLLVLCISTLGFAGCSSTNSGSTTGEINVYNWGDYIDEDLLTQFKDETGIKVNYDTYPSNEELYTKLASGNADYDIIFPSDYMVQKMINEDMLMPINYDNVPNYKNIDDKFKNLAYDPDGTFSVPYMWGTLGILYNTQMVNEPVDSWSILWDPTYTDEIYMYDSERDTIGVALKYLGYSMNSTNQDELEQAKELLIQQKPLVQAYLEDPVKDSMINGDGAVAVVYSGDALYCMQQNPDLNYVVPKEGSNAWFDAVCIPKGSKNEAGAEAFINFLCDPNVALDNSEYISYSTPNKGAYSLLPEEVQNNPIYWPPDDIFNNCEVYLDLGDFSKNYDEAWTEIMAA